MKFDVYCLGHAIMDVLVDISEDELLNFDFEKGTMALIKEYQLMPILEKLNHLPKNNQPAGSAANTAMAVASLGGKSVFTGVVGNDEHGREYARLLAQRGVHTRIVAESATTGRCICLITPDSQRTMATFLGASQAVRKEHVDEQLLKESRFLHIEGFQWNLPEQKEATLHAIRLAKKHGVKVSFDLADPLLVAEHREEFKRLISEHVDIAFANEDEAFALTELPVEKGLKKMGELAEIAAVKLAANGSLIRQNGKTHVINGFKAKAVDSTGAGDVYAAGVLYGLSKGLGIEKAGKLGSFLGARIVEQYGSSFRQPVREKAKRFLG